MEISESRTDNVVVMQISGTVTLGQESTRLRARFKELLSDGSNRLILDLSNVRYVDSAGMGAVVAGYTTARAEGGDIKLARPCAQFRDQLTMTKLDTVFEVYPTIEDAVRAFDNSH